MPEQRPEYRAYLTQEQVTAQAARLGEFLVGLSYLDCVRVLNFALSEAVLASPDAAFRAGCAQAIAEVASVWARR